MSDIDYREDYQGYHDNTSERKTMFRRKKGRAQGDFLLYFVVHNLLSAIMFFSIAIPLQLFEKKIELISDVFSLGFLELIINVFAISLFTGVVARIVSYLILRLIIVVIRKKEMKKFMELNQGINKISLSYVIALFISAILFSVGALTILQYLLFDEETLLTLLLTYIVIKVGVFLLVRFFVGSKL